MKVKDNKNTAQFTFEVSELFCLHSVLDFYKRNNPNFRHDLGQGGTCADLVESMQKNLRAMLYGE